jgi:hypothetical protein
VAARCLGVGGRGEQLGGNVGGHRPRHRIHTDRQPRSTRARESASGISRWSITTSGTTTTRRRPSC